MQIKQYISFFLLAGFLMNFINLIPEMPWETVIDLLYQHSSIYCHPLKPLVYPVH